MSSSSSLGVLLAAAGALAVVTAVHGCSADPADRFLCEGEEQTCSQTDSEGNPFVCFEGHCWPRAEVPDAGDPGDGDAGPDAGDAGDAGPDPEEDAGPELVEPLDAGPDYGMVDLGPHCRAGGLLCVENPVSGGERLNAIDGRAWNDVWVVGNANTVLQWNGAVWRRTVIPDGLQGALSDVEVMDRGIHISGDQRRLAGWDGGWQSSEPDVQNMIELRSLSRSGDTLFVGGDHGELAAIIVTDGGTARVGGGAALEPFLEVWADSPTTAWAISDGGVARLSLTFDGLDAGWGGPNAHFRDLDGISADTVYLVGDNALYERSGSGWSNLSVLGLGDFPNFNAVWAAPDGGAWATTRDTAELFAITGGLTPTEAFAFPGGADGLRLRGVWGDATGEIWAIGDKGLIVRRFGNAFVRVPGSATPELHALAQGPARRLFAVGEARTVLMRRGTTWIPLLPEVSGADSALFDLSSTEDGMWVAGKGLGRLTWSADAGASLAMAAGTTSSAYRAIAATAQQPLFAVGLGGAFAYYTPPATWTSPGSPFGSVDMLAAEPSRDGRSIWIAGAGKVYEANDAGFQDRTVDLPANVRFEDVWAESPGEVFVAGTNVDDATRSELYRYSGGAWTPYDVGARVTALGGQGGKVWAAAGGRIFEWTGSGWRDLGQLSGFRFDTSFSSDAGVWFAGSDGVVVRLDAGQ